MNNKYFIPTLAVLGALFGLFIVYWTQTTVPVPPILFPPPKSPYAHAIAASGIIEASSQNISVGTPFNEIIDKIFVVEGDRVKTGDPLFKLDTQTFESQLAAAKAELELTKVDYLDKQKQYSFYQRLKDTRAASEQNYQLAYYAYLEAEKNVTVAQANVKIAETNIERSTVRAPVDGVILQLNIHIGEIAPIIPFISSQALWQTVAQGSLLLMGAVEPLQVRVDIDEDDAWRFEKGSPATAFVRGNSHIHFPLKFLRIEPYIIPKSSFTGNTTERVDTRVLQVLYNFEKNDLPVYPGQVLDLYIESKPIESFIKK